jgi:hypothetical protein
MARRPISAGNAVPTTSGDPDDTHGALVVVAAAAGLVWALAHDRSSDGARTEPAPKPRPTR